jgi:hypothetical protein
MSENNLSNYEFNESENILFSKLSKVMRIVGILFLALGILYIISGFVPFNIVFILQGAAYGVIGYSLVNAATAFKKIVDTEGNDIGNLMYAVKQLYTACATQLYSIIAVVVLILLSFFL